MSLVPKLTEKDFLGDNHSEEARIRRELFTRAEQTHNQILVMRCSDPREVITYVGTVTAPSIAAAGDPLPYTLLIRDPAIALIAVVTHFAGSTLVSGKAPSGCGGLGAKKSLNKRNQPVPMDRTLTSTFSG